MQCVPWLNLDGASNPVAIPILPLLRDLDRPEKCVAGQSDGGTKKWSGFSGQNGRRWMQKCARFCFPGGIYHSNLATRISSPLTHATRRLSLLYLCPLLRLMSAASLCRHGNLDAIDALLGSPLVLPPLATCVIDSGLSKSKSNLQQMLAFAQHDPLSILLDTSLSLYAL